MKPTLAHIIAEYTGQGIYDALKGFCWHNKIITSATHISKDPIDDVMLLLTAEYEPTRAYEYPFSSAQSLKTRMDKIMVEHFTDMGILMEDGDNKDLKKFITILACGETLEFLDQNKEVLVNVFRSVRLNIGGFKALPPGGPHG